ncbi:hypothetical protein [Salisediminibacterium halotolerans]|uniref:SurA N-terminal domain-containing protein n=1 Tax=Salisediminibacterium halotolerans TaxID=517425 RepID=A0A1H9V5R6_9BACI|nr:hypothetical protein [Salisediminibacterium haloalkalitolerans]SES17065.1 hypothetical protein SAMN05444126_11817 [Salisediminibacterium haloalkalitolerans]
MHRFLPAVLFLLMLQACTSGSEPTPPEVEVDQLESSFSDQQPPLSAEDYRDLTDRAVTLFNNRAYLLEDAKEDDELKKWFIRYYIQKHEFEEDWDEEEILQLALDRQSYEKAWREYAEDEYEVTISEEMIKQQAEYNVQVYQDSMPPIIKGMSASLDKTIEEFMTEFDRDHVERTVIWQRLIPTLLEEYEQEASDYVNGVFLRQEFDEEVLTYMEEEYDEEVPEIYEP